MAARGLIGAVLVAGMLAGCGPTGIKATPVSDGVQWADYSAGVRIRIDGLIASKDCGGLQAEFDAADATGAAMMTRTGHNNARLMTYLDAAMKGAGCY